MNHSEYKPSPASQPDLDWSQVRETIKMLTVSVVQVENSIKIGDQSVGVLTDTFASLVDDMKSINEILHTMPDSEVRNNALTHCQASEQKIYDSIVAFQFYDRLQQCLDHVSVSLLGLSAIIDDPQRLYNPSEWRKLQTEIRNRYTMESEKVMLDAILQGKSIEEALALAESCSVSDNDIEMF